MTVATRVLPGTMLSRVVLQEVRGLARHYAKTDITVALLIGRTR
jgi:hypothetical protein